MTSTDIPLPASQPVTLTPTQIDLRVRFGNITLPTTINYGANGKAQITITNVGKTVAQGPLKINLYISANSKLDLSNSQGIQNVALLSSLTQNINLSAGQSTTLTLNYQNNTSLISPGAYHLIAQIEPGNISNADPSKTVADKLISAPGVNQAHEWLSTALNAIQAEGQIPGSGVNPVVQTRILALESTAVYDAVEAFTHNYQSYGKTFNAPAGASQDAAVVGAAYAVLSKTPQLSHASSLLQAQLTKSLLEIRTHDSQSAITAGLKLGQEIGNYILASRANDGSNNNTPYNPTPSDPNFPSYVWRPTDYNGFVAVGPNWGSVTPWAIPNVASFSAPQPKATPANPSIFQTQIQQIKDFGGVANTANTTILRTPGQTELALFWSYDQPNTFRPPGQLNEITQQLAIQNNYSLEQTARLYAAQNVALADNAIVVWSDKYIWKQPRPQDIISGSNGDPSIASQLGYDSLNDPNWRPLINTPPFPDYTSGHSSFAGAWAGVLDSFFGSNYQFSAVSQNLPGVVRNFASIDAAAYEDAISRVYGGIHTLESTTGEALPLGERIGQYVVNNLFQPTHAPSPV